MKKVILILILFSFSSAGLAEENGIKHIVLCWLHQKNDLSALEKVIETSKELEMIPFVDSIAVGTALPSDRAVVDDSFDVGLVMNFKNQQDLAKYLIDEEHVKRVKTVMAPQCGKVLIYDVAY